MSYTKTVLKKQRKTGGIIRPVFGMPFAVLEHAPRSPNDSQPFVVVEPQMSDPFRYSGREVEVDTRTQEKE